MGSSRWAYSVHLMIDRKKAFQVEGMVLLSESENWEIERY